MLPAISAGDALLAFFLALGDFWQIIATLLLLVLAYVVLSVALGAGVKAGTDAFRRRRAAKRAPNQPAAQIDDAAEHTIETQGP
ncbi:hypothetical protein H4J02_02555 [Protaetiibacter sp. SSC-01]|uniref:hypothetical protein n=1 Tax=Protaetiibacter sp. SSC-01 TaxID=2759943 RepID=UPI001656F7C8|nr:hypothetical protein [Protaetiibacter sp. SSC-01]QNO37940.1 hypothetical protein H4J02_02555 [Protaetiibacter sp. SSC-01]